METTSATAISFTTAFIGGLVSFITPCVLPLVPVYLSILSGTSFSQLTAKEGQLDVAERNAIHKKVITNALAFILGFTVVFIIAGLFAAVIGAFVKTFGDIIYRILGAVIILLGMNMSGFYKPKFLNMEARFHVQKGRFGLISSFIIGAAFAFGWTPCVGPILAPILALAAGTGSKLKGSLMLFTYSMGLGVPFFLSALSINGLLAFSSKMKRHFNTMELIVGTLLMFIGVFLLVGGDNGMNMIRGMLESMKGD
jgi:cytochrome c-type biogenesis protein